MKAGDYVEGDWFDHPLPPNIAIGDRSWIYSSFAFIHFASTREYGLRVGSDCGIYDPTFFDIGPEGEVSIGHYTTLGGPIISTNGLIEIGNHSLVSFNSVIGDSHFARPAIDGLSPAGDPDSRIVIRNNVWVGARAMILPGADIGSHSIIGAGSVVDFEVPPWSLVVGNPARVARSLRPHMSVKT